MTGSVVVIDPSIPEFSSVPLVVLGMLVLAVFVLVAGRNAEACTRCHFGGPVHISPFSVFGATFRYT